MGKNEKKKKKNSTQERRRLWNPPPHICPGTAGEHTLAVFEAVSSAVCVMEVCLTDFSVREPTFDINLQFLAAGSWPEKDKMYQSVFLSLNWVSFPSEIKGNIKFCYSKQYCSNRKSLEENLAGLPYSWCLGVGKECHIWTGKYWIFFFFFFSLST